jgi:hypothetical protein
MLDDDRLADLLDAYLCDRHPSDDEADNMLVTSQEIADNLREMADITTSDVTEFCLGQGFPLVTRGDRLYWRMRRPDPETDVT